MEPDSTSEPYSCPDQGYNCNYWDNSQVQLVSSTTEPHSPPYEYQNHDIRMQVLHVTGSDEGHLDDSEYPDPDGWWDPAYDDIVPMSSDDDDDDDDDSGDDADDELDVRRPPPSPILIEDSPPPSPILIDDDVLNSDDDI
ncbi:uncharacterized protein isoform X2 [Leptinotarsa decemlineata]|uniref:uncharacterized protein isoform X2 n=1 Tax=Leptinotarsa decemlineata TaxID=7539 RepID=UPI003D30B65E